VPRRNQPPDHLPLSIRDHVEVVRACREWNIGRLFRIINNLSEEPAKFTVTHIGRRCGLTPSRVLEYMKDAHQVTNISIIERIADGLGIPGERFGLAARPWEESSSTAGPLDGSGLWHPKTLTPDDTERLVGAIHRPSRVDGQVIGSLANVLAAQRRLEDHVGSAAVVVPVSAQLDALSGMVVDARGILRPKLVDVTGQWALFAGWLTANMGRFDVSRSWFDRAAEWAAESGNVSLNSAVLSWKGHLAYLTGQLGPLVGLSQAARRNPGVVMAQRAYDAYQEARGHALTKEIIEAERCLGEAETLAAQALERPEETPPWAYYHTSPGFYVMEHGLVLRYLGLHDRKHNSLATGYLTAGLDELPVEMQRSEWAADFMYQLAMCHLQSDDPDEACRRAIQAAEIANATCAVRLVRKLESLHAQLAKTWPALSSVSELGEFVKE
jgi:hypothetical protein